MTNTYVTGNPVGSTSLKDLSDNSSNFDEFSLSTSPAFTDRQGKRRETIAGIEAKVENFLTSSGFTWIGEYTAGLTFSARNQYTVRSGIAYRVATAVNLPYTTTGNWASEVGNFVAFDAQALLSNEIANTSDSLKGAALVGRAVQVVATVPALLALSAVSASNFAYVVSLASMFALDETDVSSADNGFDIRVASDGGRWKLIDPNVPNMHQFGATGDGSTNDAVAFQRALNIAGIGTEIFIRVPAGVYLLNTALVEGAGKVHWIYDRGVSFTGSAALPFTPKKIQLGGSAVSPATPVQTIIEGSPTNPLTDRNYRTPALYLERHTNGNLADSCNWGNPKKQTPLLVECLAYANETGEVNAFAGRVFTNTSPSDPNAHPLVGVSSLAQSNAPDGQMNRQVFGANFVAASSTGLTPDNIVGIECDIIPSSPMPDLRPGEPGAKNVTAYWAQAASTTANCNTAFLATSVTTEFGWLYGMLVDAPVYNHLAYLRTSLNAPSARGLRIETQYGLNTGRVLELFTGANEQMRVDGDPDSPVWIRVGTQLKRVLVGAADSGGAGYKMLRVVN